MSPETLQNEDTTDDLSIQIQSPVINGTQTRYQEDNEDYVETNPLLPPDENSQKQQQIEPTNSLKNKRKKAIRLILLIIFILLIVVLLAVCIIIFNVFITLNLF